MSCEVLGRGITSTQKPLTSLTVFPKDHACLRPPRTTTERMVLPSSRSGKGGSDCGSCRTRPLPSVTSSGRGPAAVCGQPPIVTLGKPWCYSVGTEGQPRRHCGKQRPSGWWGRQCAPRLTQRTMDASLICPLSLSDSLDRFKGLKPTVILLSRGISDAESSWRAGQGWQRKGRLRSVVWARTKPPPSE